MNILILQIVCTVIVSVLFFFLLHTGRRLDTRPQAGWGFVVAGFGLVLFGMLLGIGASVPALGRIMLVGNLSAATFLQYFLGYLLGYFFLTVGLLKWIPAIARLREMERALVESEQRFNSIAGQAPDAIVLADEHGKIAFWNPAAEKLFGYTAAEILGKGVDDIFVSLADDHPMRVAGSAMSAEGGAEIFPELTARRKDGETLPVELSVSFLKFEGRWHAAGIMRDVEERQRLQTQLIHAQKMEIVGRLAAGIAHDFNNILSAIMGYSELLRMKMENADPRCRYVDNILGASRRGSNLSQRLLVFSRQQKIEKQVIDVCRTVARLQNLLGRLLGEDIEVRANIPDGGLTIFGDEAQIEQVLINLATNARDAMPDGGLLEIEVKTEHAAGRKLQKHGPERKGDYVLITVRDSGSGIDDTALAHIYEPFFTTKEVGKGTGLGLAIVYSVLQQHEGHVEVLSKPGQGTTFQIYLPLVHEAAPKIATLFAEIPPGGSETILVAEDDQTVRSLIRTVLEDGGYRVVEAINGQDAINEYRKNRDRIGLLFLDVIMPKKDGRQVYDEIGATAAKLKVIFVSGYSGEILQRRGIPDGGFHFIAKPLSPLAILRTVREVLDE
ncbi:MAG: hybrid sensor histidine kinase/response regulator [Candidatus Methylomirabilia bacterium]